MPRKVNELDYAEKRDEILAVAQQLVYSKGYEQMTIQDLLVALGISKGAFYHYFDSKQALLEGLIERIRLEGQRIAEAILSDTSLPTLERLQRFFDTVGRWKTAQKEYLIELLRIWYTDDNAVVRQKVQATMIRDLAAALTPVIVQGRAEGVFTTPFPTQAGAIALSLLIGFGETLGSLLLSTPAQPDAFAQAEQICLAYNDALERVLGAPAGSLHLIDLATLAEWFAVLPAEALDR